MRGKETVYNTTLERDGCQVVDGNQVEVKIIPITTT